MSIPSWSRRTRAGALSWLWLFSRFILGHHVRPLATFPANVVQHEVVLIQFSGSFPCCSERFRNTIDCTLVATVRGSILYPLTCSLHHCVCRRRLCLRHFYRTLARTLSRGHFFLQLVISWGYRRGFGEVVVDPLQGAAQPLEETYPSYETGVQRGNWLVKRWEDTQKRLPRISYPHSEHRTVAVMACLTVS